MVDSHWGATHSLYHFCKTVVVERKVLKKGTIGKRAIIYPTTEADEASCVSPDIRKPTSGPRSANRRAVALGRCGPTRAMGTRPNQRSDPGGMPATLVAAHQTRDPLYDRQDKGLKALDHRGTQLQQRNVRGEKLDNDGIATRSQTVH